LEIEGAYLWPLVQLGDRRVAPELVRRAKAAPPRERRLLSLSAHQLGEPEPFRSYAEDFRTGRIELPSGKAAEKELRDILRAMYHADTPDADRAVAALADAKHPLHTTVAREVLSSSPGDYGHELWYHHPFCLDILRGALDDTTPTGATFAIEQDKLRHRKPSSRYSGPIPDFLTDPAVRRDQATERASDDAAERLGKLVVGLPIYHPLFKDADDRLAAFRAAFDRFHGTYRHANPRERKVLDASYWDVFYVPDIRPLGRTATEDDVKAGKAVFHLAGKGTLAGLMLPAAAKLTGERDREKPAGVWIVQAEVGPDGATTYGIVTRHAVRAASARELTDIKSFADLDREEADAERQRKKE
jgi:hypothetical protein